MDSGPSASRCPGMTVNGTPVQLNPARELPRMLRTRRFEGLMPALALPDLLAFAWFVAAWLGYSIVIETTAKGRLGLNALMNGYRDAWMRHLLARENRIVDAQVT